MKVDTKVFSPDSYKPAAVLGLNRRSAFARSATLGLFLTLAAGMASTQGQAIAAVRPLQAGDISALSYKGTSAALLPVGSATVPDRYDVPSSVLSAAEQDIDAPLPAPVLGSIDKVKQPIELDVDISRTVIPNDDPSALADAGTVVHHVREGETLVDISKRYKVSVDAIIKANSLDNPGALSADDVLRIPANQVLAQAKVGDADERDDLLALKGPEISVESKGLDAQTFRVSPDIEAPAIARRTLLPQVTALDLPPLESSETYLPSRTFQMPTGKFKYIWPAKGVFTSGFGPRWGRMHRGIDIAAPVGTPVVASAPGIVERAGWNSGGYGKLVEIRHPDGSFTRYAHNNRILVKKGQPVLQGEKIAEMGSTGRSTGPHTHFEIRKPGKGAVNPIRYLKRRS